MINIKLTQWKIMKQSEFICDIEHLETFFGMFSSCCRVCCSLSVMCKKNYRLEQPAVISRFQATRSYAYISGRNGGRSERFAEICG